MSASMHLDTAVSLVNRIVRAIGEYQPDAAHLGLGLETGDELPREFRRGWICGALMAALHICNEADSTIYDWIDSDRKSPADLDVVEIYSRPVFEFLRRHDPVWDVADTVDD